MSKYTIIFAAIVGLVLALAPAAQAVTIDTVPVGNVGNTADAASGFGAVDHPYRMGTYEVTNEQYCEFLNAVAATDPYDLYHTSMDTDSRGGITRSGTSPSYTYAVKAGFANKPVISANWGDSARFANWLHNGQGGGSTETGAYTLNGAVSAADLWVVPRNPTWKWAIPTRDEWYKAAYHNNAGLLATDYFDYPTSSDTAPTASAPTATPNSANYKTSPAPPPEITDVDAYPGSASPYGTFDQGSNWREYTEDRYQRSPTDYVAYLQSGAYWTDKMKSDSALWEAEWVDGGGYGVVRLVQIPEPATLALLGIGGLGMLLRRRRA